jgi:hydroxymethylbilane synthase
LFLRELEGGCTAPIGALAAVKDGVLHFNGCLSSLDGSEKLYFHDTMDVSAGMDKEVCYALAKAHSLKILNTGGRELMQQIKSQTAR